MAGLIWTSVKSTSSRAFATATLLGLVLIPLYGTPAAAQQKAKPYSPPSAELVMDFHTGEVLYSRSADAERHPASLTKVMTLYMLFEELESGKTTLDSKIRVSTRAAGQVPSRLGMRAGERIRVEDAIYALVTKSANDVACAIAEHLAGTEPEFARRMTQRAKQLGMNRTVFKNASGLPNRAQITTARDMAILAKRVQIDFPQYYHYFSTKEFVWKDNRFRSHNHLLGRYVGTTGLKTGFTNASGFNLTATVQRDGKAVIGVVLGGRSVKARDDQMIAILDRAMPRALALRETGVRVAAATTATPVQRAATPSAPAAEPRRERLVASAAAVTPSAQNRPKPVVLPLQSPLRVASAEPAAAPSQPALAPASGVLPTPATAEKAPAPVERATAYAVQAGRDLGNLIITPAHASEGTQPAASLPAPASTPLPQSVWAMGDPLIPSGTWVIQIGAYASQGDAVARIRQAIKTAPETLNKAIPVTIPVKTADNKTLYRSRFGGFIGEKDARNACGRLARENISCVAIPPANWSLPKAASDGYSKKPGQES